MAKEKKDKKSDSKKHSSHNKGGVSFGVEVLLVIIIVFIIWVLTGGPSKEKNEDGMLINPMDITPVTPTSGY